MDLTVIWACIIGFAIVAYVVMDGFDLGIGILFPFYKPGEDRDTAMNSIAPVWDGNETWLVMGVGGLFAAFPLAYAIVLPALYAPMIAMLLGLVFRGVAFEFRWRDPEHRAFWDAGFTTVIGLTPATTTDEAIDDLAEQFEGSGGDQPVDQAVVLHDGTQVRRYEISVSAGGGACAVLESPAGAFLRIQRWPD